MPIRTSGNPDGISVLVHRKSSVVMWPILKMHYSLKSCRCYFCIKYFLISLTVASSAFQVFQSKDVPEKSTTPEEFIRMTKGITVATAKAVAAGNSAQQEDVISTANLSRKAISDMLNTCKVLIHHHTNTISPYADQL